MRLVKLTLLLCLTIPLISAGQFGLSSAGASSAPIADFTYSPSVAMVGENIAFTDISSGTVASWLWDFGDGSTSTQQNPTHSYISAGRYSVTLTVTNDVGLNDSHTMTILVEPRYGREPTPAEKDVFEQKFPNLAHGFEWRVTSSATDVYNCYAWSVGIDSHWLVSVPDIDQKYGDKDDIPEISDWDQFYAAFGYSQVSSLDQASILFYCVDNVPKHAARRYGSLRGSGNLFESKCGQLARIVHEPEHLEDHRYGHIVMYQDSTLIDAPWWPDTVGAQMAVGEFGRITVYWNRAFDSVDAHDIKYNIYYDNEPNHTNTVTNLDFDAAERIANVIPENASSVGYYYKFTIPNLAIGVPYYIGVRAEDQAGNEETNRVEVSATTLITGVVLEIEKQASSSTIYIGETATITTRIRNVGDVIALNANVSDNIPDGLASLGTTSAHGNLWGSAAPPSVDIYVRDTNTWINSSEAEWCIVSQLGDNTWEYSFEDMKGLPSSDNDFGQPLLRVQKEDNQCLVTLENYGGDFRSDIYVGDVLLWSGAGGGEDENWGVGETRVAPPLELRLHIRDTGENVWYHEAQWCRFRLIEEGGWLYRFEDLKEQPLSLEPSGIYDYNQPILLVEKVGGNYEVTIEAYESAYHSDIWVEGTKLWTGAGGPDRTHVDETKSVPIVNTTPQVKIIVQETGKEILSTESDWCKFAALEAGSWLYLFEDLKGQPVEPDYDYNQPIIIVQRTGDQYIVTLEEYKSAYHGDIYAGDNLLWGNAGGENRACVGDNKSVRNPYPTSLTYSYVVQGDNADNYVITTTATCKDMFGETYTVSASVAIEVKEQGDAGSRGDAGNTPAEARTISAGDHEGYLGPTDDNDFYENWISGSMLRVSMFPPSDADFDLYLYDPDLNLVASSENRGSASEEAIHVVRVSGHYYIEIRRFSGSGCYTFTVEIDDTPPTSSVNPIIPYWHNTLPMTVTAQASDDLSGVESVALWYQYSADDVTWGPDKLFGVDTEAPWSWSFTANDDGYYKFYTIATDRGAKVEEAPVEADAQAGVDRVPPESLLDNIDPYWQSELPLTITATASDDRSGVKEVMLFYKHSSSNLDWGDWQLFGVDSDNSDNWSWEFDAPENDGHYQFGTLAIDRAGNCELGEVEQRTLEGEVRGGVEGGAGAWQEPRWMDGEIHIEDEELWLLWMEIEGEGIGAIWENGGYSPTDVGVEIMDVGEVPADLEWGYGGWEIWGTISSEQPVRRRNVLVENISGEIWGQYWVEEWGAYDEPAWLVGEFSGSVTAEVRITWPEATASALVLRQIEFEETSEDTILANRPIYYGFTVNTSPISLTLDWDDGDLDLHLYDPEGRHVGWNYETNELELEMPGVEYSGRGTKPERIQVTDPQSGLWMVMIYPYEVEETTSYTLGISRDVSPPESFVEQISPYWHGADTIPFEVSARASDPTLVDEEVPSGVEIVELWYRYFDNPTWHDWQLYDVDDDEPYSWSFTAENGRYEFYSVATDRAGNREEAPENADAWAGVDTTPPESWVDELASYWQNADMVPFTLSAEASDEVSGVENVELWCYYSPDNSTWDSPTLCGTDVAYPWSWSFSPETDGYYGFYSVATDAAGNVEEVATAQQPQVVFEEDFNDLADGNLAGQTGWTEASLRGSGGLTVSSELPYEGAKGIVATTHHYTTYRAYREIESVQEGKATVYMRASSGAVETLWLCEGKAPENGRDVGYGCVRIVVTLDGRDNLLRFGTMLTVPAASDTWHKVVVEWEAPATTAKAWVNDEYKGEFTVNNPILSHVDGIMFDVPDQTHGLKVYFDAISITSGAVETVVADAWAGVDTVPPESSAVVETYWQTSTTFAVTATALDQIPPSGAVPSGVEQVKLFYRHSLDNETWGDRTSFGTDSEEPYSWSFNIPAGHGFYKFYTVATDVANNVEEPPADADAYCATLIPATVGIDPDTLNLRSQGRWITAYIELPGDLDVADIDVGTVAIESDIFLEGAISAELQPTEVGDHDGDGVPDLMVKFDRSAVQELVSVGEVELTVIGKCGQAPFRGSDTIRVIDPGEGQGQGSGVQFEVPPGQSGEHPSQGQGNQDDQGQGPPQTPSEQGSQSSSQDQCSQGNQGQGPPETPPGQGGQIPGQGQGNQQSNSSDASANCSANEQGNAQEQGSLSTTPMQDEQTPAQGQGGQQSTPSETPADTGVGNQGNGRDNGNGGGNQGQGNAKGRDR